MPRRRHPGAIPVLLTEHHDAPPDGTVVVTPEGMPNVVVKTMSVFAQVLIRAARTYLQSLLGFLVVLMAGAPVVAKVGVQISPHDFLDVLIAAASLAVAPTVVSFLQNMLELLARLDESTPELRA